MIQDTVKYKIKYFLKNCRRQEKEVKKRMDDIIFEIDEIEEIHEELRDVFSDSLFINLKIDLRSEYDCCCTILESIYENEDEILNSLELIHKRKKTKEKWEERCLKRLINNNKKEKRSRL